MVENSLLIYRK